MSNKPIANKSGYTLYSSYSSIFSTTNKLTLKIELLKPPVLMSDIDS